MILNNKCKVCEKILHNKNTHELCSYHYGLEWSKNKRNATNIKR